MISSQRIFRSGSGKPGLRYGGGAVGAALCVLLLSSCGSGSPEPQPVDTASPANTTVSRPAETIPEGAAAAAYSTPQEATGSTSLNDTGGFDPFSVTLRLEGRAGTRFGGNCDFGDERRPVEGRVPGRFVIDTEGLELACRISPVGGRAGDQLRVVLTADGRTRSVQEVRSGGTVSVSYDPPARGG